MTRAERDKLSRQRRAEVLRLPMVPLRLHGHLDRPGYYPHQPFAVGVGPHGTAAAAWPPPEGEHGVTVTTYDGNAPYSEQPGHTQALPATSELRLPTSLRVSHVQPLPGGKVLIASARTRGTDNAEIWDASGRLEHSGLIGDGIGHLLTTPDGAIWAGYFDEGIYGSGNSPSVHGLVRFTPDLATDWAYPREELPPIDDCYALNVAGETATISAYTPFHLITVSGDQSRDHGSLPSRGAHRLLIEGEQAALIGGYGPEYDLITPVQITSTGITPNEPARRLVRPDGLETQPGPAFCRGPALNLFPQGTAIWYWLSLDEITSA